MSFSDAFICWDFYNDISFEYIHEGLIDGNSPLFQVMAWHLVDEKPLAEVMVVKCSFGYMHYQVSMS